MRKIKTLSFCFLTLYLTLFLFASCDFLFKLKGGVNLHGIEKYNIANSETSITSYLLPSEDFLDRYNCVSGDYYYIDTGMFSSHWQESALMYLIYDEQTYKEVKQFSLNSFSFSLIHEYYYNGYLFLENITFAVSSPEWHLDANGENKLFPYSFNMVGYNDEKKTMIFMGFNLGPNKTDRDRELLTFSDMGAFLKEYFSFYDFDA